MRSASLACGVRLTDTNGVRRCCSISGTVAHGPLD
jgi:hypothetical protein